MKSSRTARARIAVVGLEDGPESCAGPGLLACLAGLPRIAVATRACESGAFRGAIAEEFALVGSPGTEAFERDVLALAHERAPCAILPGNARAASALARLDARIRSSGSSLLASAPRSLEALSPARLTATCKRAGVLSLPSHELAPDATVEQVLAASAWPVTLLGGTGLRRRGFDALEVLRHARALRELGAMHVRSASPALRSIVECCVVLSGKGTSLGSCSVRVLEDDERLRAWLAVTIEDERLEHAALALGRAARITGPLLVTFALHAGDLSLLDAQAAFPSWIEACLREGPNLPRLAVDHLLGRRTPRARRVPAGTLFSQVAHDVVVDPLSPTAQAIFR